MTRRVDSIDHADIGGSDAERSFLFQIRALGLNEPTREWRFAPPRRWRFDFAWVPDKIAVEIEGGTWTGGRHVTPNGYAGDLVKYNMAALAGWTVLRFTPRMVDQGWAADVIEAALKGSSIDDVLKRAS